MNFFIINSIFTKRRKELEQRTVDGRIKPVDLFRIRCVCNCASLVKQLEQ